MSPHPSRRRGYATLPEQQFLMGVKGQLLLVNFKWIHSLPPATGLDFCLYIRPLVF